MSTRDSSASNTTLVNNSLIEIMTGPDNQRKAEQLLSFMLEKGLSFYDEVVTQLDHALQAAELAKKSNANNYLITSALLHDLGHLLLNEKSLAEDLNHEEIGANAMTTFFPSTVTEPIRLHVDAKRYLCTVDQDYYNNLSQASQNSFFRNWAGPRWAKAGGGKRIFSLSANFRRVFTLSVSMRGAFHHAGQDL